LRGGCFAASFRHVAAGLRNVCSRLRCFRARRRGLSVSLRDQHLGMCRIGLLTGTRHRPAGGAPEQESHQQATDQCNDRDTLHGGDLAWAGRQNRGGGSARHRIRMVIYTGLVVT
jgi:hypothetical protein